ncbi:hypothetical protein JHK84_031991 [Glycine max]|nr:hypothetical protein JHK84_031991 [Glycine max]
MSSYIYLGTLNWTKIDQDVFTTNRSIPVWCNVDPTKAYFGKAKIKEECDCKYDAPNPLREFLHRKY